jgi:hypothetical protein
VALTLEAAGEHVAIELAVVDDQQRTLAGLRRRRLLADSPLVTGLAPLWRFVRRTA